MKINKLNWFYMGLAFALLAAIIYQKLSYKSWERYNYSVGITAPQTFPVHVREAYFLLPGDDFESADDEDVNEFITTWGVNYGTTNHARSARLPQHLVLKYFSYRDKKFYADTLALPQKEILQMFKAAQINEQFLRLSEYAGLKKGLSFVIGIANNGNVIVWLRGVCLERELLRTQLKPVESTADDLFYEKPLSKDDYFNYAFENLSDSLKTVYISGFDANANYIDTPSRYIENNMELWQYQQKNGYIDFKGQISK
ncbi:DUF2931 family protein [Pedobacter cryotolerans]|uniref:DUF2931 family protein n=1 Tax=Pedobacter cryotolerans TaxID=2571270 RepID=A0A4U1CAZ4_9SPHI|nr:DUF2931 family protein [Pedobacter cryotolerans]TKC01773.1 DUF2931 family protein [Pedobacter cryotolerans]